MSNLEIFLMKMASANLRLYTGGCEAPSRSISDVPGKCAAAVPGIRVSPKRFKGWGYKSAAVRGRGEPSIFHNRASSVGSHRKLHSTLVSRWTERDRDWISLPSGPLASPSGIFVP